MNSISTKFSLTLFIWQLLLLLLVGFWLYCLIDILKNKFEQNDKISWVLVVLFLPILGAILYFFIGKNKKLH